MWGDDVEICQLSDWNEVICSIWDDNALKPVIAARRQAGQNIELIGSVMAMEQAGKGKADMDAMRLLLTEAKNTSSALLTERSQKVADIRSTRTTGTVS